MFFFDRVIMITIFLFFVFSISNAGCPFGFDGSKGRVVSVSQEARDEAYVKAATELDWVFSRFSLILFIPCVGCSCG